MVSKFEERAATVENAVRRLLPRPDYWWKKRFGSDAPELPINASSMNLGPADPRNATSQLELSTLFDYAPGASLSASEPIKDAGSLSDLVAKTAEGSAAKTFVAALDQSKTDHDTQLGALYNKANDPNTGSMKTFEQDLAKRDIPITRVLHGVRIERDAALSTLSKLHTTQQEDVTNHVDTLFQSPDAGAAKAVFGELSKKEATEKLQSELKAIQAKETEKLKASYEQTLSRIAQLEQQIYATHILQSERSSNLIPVRKAAEERLAEDAASKGISVGAGEAEHPGNQSIADLEKITSRLGTTITIDKGNGSTSANFRFWSTGKERRSAFAKQMEFHKAQGYKGVKWTSEGGDTAKRNIRRDQWLVSMLDFNEQQVDPKDRYTRGNQSNGQPDSPKAKFDQSFTFDGNAYSPSSKDWDALKALEAKRPLLNGKDYMKQFNETIESELEQDEKIELGSAASAPKLST